jgi:hypothetical protein
MPNVELNYLLLLPLLGGYTFLSIFYYTKFQHSRIETQRLIFHSIIIGIFLIFVSSYIDTYILKIYFLNFREFLGKFVLINIENLNFFLLTFLIAPLLGLVLNLILPTNIMMWKVIDKWGDEFEKLYYLSLNEKEFSKRLVMVTLDNNKVYVGYILRLTKPLLTQQLELIPIISGYRKEDTKKVEFTTPYIKVISELVQNDNFDIIDEELLVVLPKDKIVTASRFYPKVYERFQEQLQLIESRPNQ